MAPLRRRLARLATLRGRDGRVIAESLATLLVVQPALHLIDFPRLLAWSSAPLRTRDTGAPARWSEDEVRRVTWLVGLAAKITRARCLSTSLALSRVLARRGVPTDLRIGVEPGQGRLQAHAWLEWRGAVLNDHPNNLRRYAPFDRPIGVRNV
jgi:hypothetical protein